MIHLVPPGTCLLTFLGAPPKSVDESCLSDDDSIYNSISKKYFLPWCDLFELKYQLGPEDF
jgi:hypothetical protein